MRLVAHHEFRSLLRIVQPRSVRRVNDPGLARARTKKIGPLRFKLLPYWELFLNHNQRSKDERRFSKDPDCICVPDDIRSTSYGTGDPGGTRTA